MKRRNTMFTVRRPSVWLQALVLGMVGIASLSRNPAASAQAGAQFHVSADFIDLDVSALDRRGRPVRGLVVADFQVLEDGVPQHIETFLEVGSSVSGSVETGRSSESTATGAASPAPGRLVVLFMDDQISLDALGTRTAKEIARAVISGLASDDAAAIAFVNNPAGSREFTRDRASLNKVVEWFRSAPQAGSSTVLSLADVVGSLAAISARRKVLFYVGGGERFDPDVMNASVRPGVLNGDEGGRQGTVFQRMQALFRLAQKANVSINTFDVNGLSAPEVGAIDPRRREREFLQIVARESGGRAVINHNRPDSEVNRVLVENSAYYLLGFRSTNRKADGAYRRLEVKVLRPRVTVRARSGYYGSRTAGPR